MYRRSVVYIFPYKPPILVTRVDGAFIPRFHLAPVNEDGPALSLADDDLANAEGRSQCGWSHASHNSHGCCKRAPVGTPRSRESGAALSRRPARWKWGNSSELSAFERGFRLPLEGKRVGGGPPAEHAAAAVRM